ncbi:AraC family transcriptional regulator [uncultured Parabacteroides sp.]|uniref:helix-turn-helix domain-containing protein n=4 Tax=uncultured Parabacteroides sp. TaxID=512312 RepID=UPI002658EE67|nr:helix-turn-helix transcriptional regulator [uncultured Parabacteroides sp.]
MAFISPNRRIFSIRMVLFNTNIIYIVLNLLTLHTENKEDMPIVKHSLQAENSSCTIGITNFCGKNGTFIDTSGCIVLLITSGCATATINLKKRAFRKGYMVILFYDDVFVINDISKTFSACFATLAYETIEEVFFKINSTYFWDILYDHPVFETTQSQWSMLNGWWLQMKWIESVKEKDYRDKLLKNNIHNLLMALDIEVIHNHSTFLQHDDNRSHRLIITFFKLLAKHCVETRNVKFYADKMLITTTYLYKLCQKFLQLSPKEFINRQTISEIKTYLSNTDMSIKNIAFKLHFEDASYMCRYFRRLTGISPMDYRNTIQKK